jgi:hypothetical protein
MSPVVLFVYNRPWHTQQTLQALMHNVDADEIQLFIFSDGPKTDADESAVVKVREVCRSVIGFKQVDLIERPVNIGLADNVIDGVTTVIQRFGTVIVLEDDLVTSPGFYLFMNQALEYYEGKYVFSISGYTPALKFPAGYAYSTYLVPRIGSWGWATWREKWNGVDWELKDFDQFFRTRRTRKAYERGGNDLPTMLLKQKTGVISSWAVRFDYARHQAGQMTVYPVVSLVKNLGVDGSGTHMTQSKKYEAPTTDFIDFTIFSPADFIEPRIVNSFKRFYDTSWIRRSINFVKRINYTLKQ